MPCGCGGRDFDPGKEDLGVGFYERSILPHLINLAMKNKEAGRYRGDVVPQARGRVLEVGIGSGLNLPFYGPEVTHLFGLDPSPRLLEMAGHRPRPAHFPAEFLQASAEEIPLETGSVDTVVSTWTLCSIPDVLGALGEMRRVLKPGGSLLFVEHGLAADPGVQRWQHRLNPLWQPIGGGCNLDRKIDDLVAAAGFRLETLATGYAKGPKLMTFIYQGRARP